MQIAVAILAAIALGVALIDAIAHRAASPLHVATILIAAALLVMVWPLR